jgi:predicted permease
VFWRPIRWGPSAYDERDNTYQRVIARLRPGVTIDQARAELAAASATLARMYPDTNRNIGAVVIPLREEVSVQARTLLVILAAASGCLLLIGGTNLVSLFLARASSRARELAVRTALGAGRERLVRQLLTESVLISLTGGLLGIGLAGALVPAAEQLVPTLLPISNAAGLSGRMLVIATALTGLTGVLSGVVPAWRASRQTDGMALRSGGRVGASPRHERLRSVLVFGQVAASVALLVCAGLLLRALWRIQQTDPGFRTGHVLTMRINLPLPKYGLEVTRDQFDRRVIDEVRALPSVTTVAFTSFLPMTMRGGIWGVSVAGQPRDPNRPGMGASARFVTPAYFDVLGIPLKSGRTFDDRDRLDGQQALIVSETFGRRLWPGESPIGREVSVMGTPRTIVGVVGEVRARGLEPDSEPQMYFSSTQQPDNSFVNFAPRDLAVRTVETSNAGSGSLAESIRRIVARADTELPVSDVRPMSDVLALDTRPRSVQARVLAAFAATAWLLAAVGLHGLLAFVVSTRTREIGVRLALGAQRSEILTMVLRRGLVLAGLGAIAGLAIAFLTARSLRVLLAGVGPADGLTIGAAVVLGLVMTIAGSLVPALRAARTDPMTATRAD